MKRSSTKLTRKGFTLVELLTVIAIIGILAAILIPAVGKVRLTAQKTTASRNLSSIATGYIAYSNDGGRTKTISEENIYEWARVLAQYGDINDGAIWALDFDPLVERQSDPIPSLVAKKPTQRGADWVVDSDFLGYPISFAVANKLSSRSKASSTPLAWTRGLTNTGFWKSLESPEPSPFGEELGLIVFLDGHVEEHNDLTEEGGQLRDWSSQDKTSDIKRAISPGAEILESTGS